MPKAQAGNRRGSILVQQASPEQLQSHQSMVSPVASALLRQSGATHGVPTVQYQSQRRRSSAAEMGVLGTITPEEAAKLLGITLPSQSRQPGYANQV